MWGLVGCVDLPLWGRVGNPALVLGRLVLRRDCQLRFEPLVDPRCLGDPDSDSRVTPAIGHWQRGLGDGLGGPGASALSLGVCYALWSAAGHRGDGLS